ncbi:ABC transporter permease [Streptomyces sp. NPDC026294]|uniref:ABC transporter permease n=1 Tax=Streptomyces sp. NPDC026294 TaxID=3155362 RepID=UPI0034025ECA
MTRVLSGLAVADFKDRVRRPAYGVTLAAAVALGYVAVPDSGARWVVMQLGDYRGVYNSAYVGTATALACGLWISLGGFYVVRDSIGRDRRTGVGQLLAATPVRTWAYLAGKFLSNLLVLASMVGVLALTALVMQLVRGEDRSVDLVALWRPFLLLAVPLVALAAAFALFFEALPLLRGGLGNIVWFCMWVVLAVGGQGPGLPLGGIGVNGVAVSMYEDMLAQRAEVDGAFSLGLTYLDEPLRVFDWHGFTPDAGYVLARLAFVGIAVAVALLPALWFHRFDPARAKHSAERPQERDQAAGGGPAVFVDGMPRPAGDRRISAAVLRTPPRPGRVLLRLWGGELRILLQGVSKWWWWGAGFWVFLGVCSPMPGATRLMLPVSWLWPVLVWSRLGTQHHEHGVAGILGAYPSAYRRVVAEWAAGATLTAAVGLGPLVRLVVEGDVTGVTCWAAGALFVPSLALALGTLSRTHRLFQAVYLPLWYTVANGLPVFDFMGAIRIEGQPAGLPPAVVLTASAVLVAVVFLTGAMRRLNTGAARRLSRG